MDNIKIDKIIEIFHNNFKALVINYEDDYAKVKLEQMWTIRNILMDLSEIVDSKSKEKIRTEIKIINTKYYPLEYQIYAGGY